MSLKEEPFFFSRDEARLFAMLHRADGSPKAGMVLCHPFGEEKLWSHRVYVSFARALAARGFAVLRFDFMGAGDSSGMTPDTSLDSHLADLAGAIDALRAREPSLTRIGLAGLRLGASVAAIFAERAAQDARMAHLHDGPLVLWDPVLDGENHFQELLRSNLSTQLAVFGKVRETREILQERIRAGGTVNVDGYEIGKALFESCARPDLIDTGPKKHRGPVLVVQISANDKLPMRPESESLAAAYGAGGSARVVEQAFWREIKPFYARANNLQDATIDWLAKSHG